MTALLRASVEGFAARVGSDLMLIQGAGGNISWKDDETLWVKASGTWLAHAKETNLFVAVDLAGVRACIASGSEDYRRFTKDPGPLRPSIETALHALLPQTIVAHLHAIDALAHSVLVDGAARVMDALAGIDWMWVPYRKPGAPLALQIMQQLAERRSTPDLLILGNHGIVLCGDSVAAVETLCHQVVSRLRCQPRTIEAPDRRFTAQLAGYSPSTNAVTMALAIDPINSRLVDDHWVMYPDHAVFLGPFARVFATIDEAARAIAADDETMRGRCPCVIVRGVGAWLPDDAPEIAWLMLDCYAEVCRRLSDSASVASLGADDVRSLLNWEAESYRRALSN